MKYSIITINFNNREGLRRTIESVISQTFRDFEFIIIDGGSTDGSIEILKEYDKNITYWVSEKDKGIYNAMNKGIEKATGDYLNFMNSGDCFFNSETLEKVSKYKSKADFIIGKDFHYDEIKKLGHASIQPTRITMIHFFVSTLDHQSSFIKRELFDNSLYDETHKLVSDWIFYIQKIVIEDKKVYFIPDIICRREDGGLSEQQKNTNRAEIKEFLHKLLPQGIYEDYASLSKLDRISLYRLFNICDSPKKRKYLLLSIKFIEKFIH